MDIASALEAFAERGSAGSAQRLAADETKTRLRARVARGQRVASLTIATGLAAAAAIVIAAGAWAAPHVFAGPAQIAPGPPTTGLPTATPQVQTPTTATPTPEPGFYTYEPTPAEELLWPGDDGYLATLLGVYEQSGRMLCDDVPNVPVSTNGYPFPDYVRMMPTRLGLDRMYDSDPGITWQPLYAQQSLGYYDAVQTAREFRSLDAEEIILLVDPNGWWWGFHVDYPVLDLNPDDPGVVVRVAYSGDGCNGGGGRPYGGPMPSGRFAARTMTYYPGEDLTVVRDLGVIEVMESLPLEPLVGSGD